MEDHGTWYSREANNVCSQCLSHSLNSWRLSGVTVVVIIYFGILIYLNLKTVEAEANKESNPILDPQSQSKNMVEVYDEQGNIIPGTVQQRQTPGAF